MFNEDTSSQTSAPESTQPAGQPIPPEEVPDKIIIRMWPKTPLLYPVAVFALICGIVGYLWGASPHIAYLARQADAGVEMKAGSTPSENADTSEKPNVGESPENATATEDMSEEKKAATTPESTSGKEQGAAAIDPEILQKRVDKIISGHSVDRVFGILFIFLFAFSLFTLCVDLEIRWALIIFSAVIVVLLILYIINEQIDFLPGVLEKLVSMSPTASPQFYFSIFVIWGILILISLAIVRFHYVKIESNEVMVVGGLLERQQRYPTIRMKYTKDVQDVIEYYMPLVRSGRLILHFPDQNDSVVIDNVIQIEKVIEELDKISGVMQVGGLNK